MQQMPQLLPTGHSKLAELCALCMLIHFKTMNHNTALGSALSSMHLWLRPHTLGSIPVGTGVFNFAVLYGCCHCCALPVSTTAVAHACRVWMILLDAKRTRLRTHSCLHNTQFVGEGGPLFRLRDGRRRTGLVGQSKSHLCSHMS